MSKVPVDIVGPPKSAGFEAQPHEVPSPAPTPDFASDEAAELWIENHKPALPPSPGGKSGYTVADVRAALRED